MLKTYFEQNDRVLNVAIFWKQVNINIIAVCATITSRSQPPTQEEEK